MSKCEYYNARKRCILCFHWRCYGVIFIGVNNNDTNNNNPTIDNGKWILDNGCTAHLCNNKNDFTNMCEIYENLNLISNASTNMKGKR